MDQVRSRKLITRRIRGRRSSRIGAGSILALLRTLRLLGGGRIAANLYREDDESDLQGPYTHRSSGGGASPVAVPWHEGGRAGRQGRVRTVVRRLPRRPRAGTAGAGTRPVHARLPGTAADRPRRRGHDDERLFGGRGQRRGRQGNRGVPARVSALVAPKRRLRGSGRCVGPGDVRRERRRHRRPPARPSSAARTEPHWWSGRTSAPTRTTAATRRWRTSPPPTSNRLAIAWRWRPEERAAEGVRHGARQLHVDADHDRQRRST